MISLGTNTWIQLCKIELLVDGCGWLMMVTSGVDSREWLLPAVLLGPFCLFVVTHILAAWMNHP